MTRRAINASEAIDETDSPVEASFDEGTLAIRSQTTGNVKGMCKRDQRPINISVMIESWVAHGNINNPCC